VSLADKTAYLFGRLASTYDYVLRRCAARHGLTALQSELLMAVARGGGARGVTALSRTLLLTQPTVSDALAALVKKGLVEVAPGVDKRTSTPRLTDRGREVAAEIKRCMSIISSAMQQLGGEDLRGLFHGLLKLAAGLYKAGVILEARICLTCKYLSKRGGYYCSLLKAPISVEELRVDCPDHSSAARPAQWK
jgi:DNA-binding MarR family transcriptional regulator